MPRYTPQLTHAQLDVLLKSESHKKTFMARFVTILDRARNCHLRPKGFYLTTDDYDALCKELAHHADIDVLAVYGVTVHEGIIETSYLLTSTYDGLDRTLGIDWPAQTGAE